MAPVANASNRYGCFDDVITSATRPRSIRGMHRLQRKMTSSNRKPTCVRARVWDRASLACVLILTPRAVDETKLRMSKPNQRKSASIQHTTSTAIRQRMAQCETNQQQQGNAFSDCDEVVAQLLLAVLPKHTRLWCKIADFFSNNNKSMITYNTYCRKWLSEVNY